MDRKCDSNQSSMPRPFILDASEGGGYKLKCGSFLDVAEEPKTGIGRTAQTTGGG